MSYRPITDTWILARSKVKYYGAFPAGFLERARDLLGVGMADPVLHVCAGRVREYPYAGFGPNDKTLDLDPACHPDFLRDARDAFPLQPVPGLHGTGTEVPWAAVLIDRPYTEEDAKHYLPGPDKLPSANLLLKNALAVVAVGSKVGILDYVWPQPPTVKVDWGNGEDFEKVTLEPRAKEVAVITVGTGRNGRARYYTVWRKLR